MLAKKTHFFPRLLAVIVFLEQGSHFPLNSTYHCQDKLMSGDYIINRGQIANWGGHDIMCNPEQRLHQVALNSEGLRSLPEDQALEKNTPTIKHTDIQKEAQCAALEVIDVISSFCSSMIAAWGINKSRTIKHTLTWFIDSHWQCGLYDKSAGRAAAFTQNSIFSADFSSRCIFPSNLQCFVSDPVNPET